MMLPRSTHAWQVFFRRFNSLSFQTLDTPASPKPQHHNLLERVRLLATSGHLKEAFSLFYSLKTPHCHQTYATLFHACARHSCFHEGLSLHRFMVAHDGANPVDLFVANHIINMYCKSGYLDYAQQLFDTMLSRNLVSWTALISGYAQRGKGEDCFRLFSSMLVHYRPNEFAFASVLSSCSGGHGRQVHALALKMSWDASVFVANALITMYSKGGGFGDVLCDCIKDAWTVFKSMEFRNLISWNSMIAVFQFLGLGTQAMDLFIQMQHNEIGFDRATLLSILSSLCGSNDNDVDVFFRFCLQLHCLTVKIGFIADIKVATALVKAYSDLGGHVDDCYRLFMETSCHGDIVSWTSIIAAFAERYPEEAFFLYTQLCQGDLAPDHYSFSIALKACAGLMTERNASAVHTQVIKSGFGSDTVLLNTLIHAYSRCSLISLSKQVFDEIEDRDVISWNSMLKAYALHGQAREALLLFSQMNLQPDPTTFVALLFACSHTELVEEGIKIFESMFENYGIVPHLDHFACMVDILGRAGRIHEAEKIISEMPMEPDSVVWSALLGSCRKHGETELAKLAADKLKELAPGKSLGYVQMSNVFCSSGNFNDACIMWKEMKGYGVRKEPGLSWIEIGNQVHEFASGGQSHPERDVICSKLEGLIGQLKEMGYVPETSLAVYDVEEEQKEEQLLHHSEKLALMFAIMNEDSLSRGGSVIRIIKNIRICVDCHKFMKLASKLFQKEIFVRDLNRFHHFKDGVCSCNDYW